jgi:hypothetical protein
MKMKIMLAWRLVAISGNWNWSVNDVVLIAVNGLPIFWTPFGHSRFIKEKRKNVKYHFINLIMELNAWFSLMIYFSDLLTFPFSISIPTDRKRRTNSHETVKLHNKLYWESSLGKSVIANEISLFYDWFGRIWIYLIY